MSPARRVCSQSGCGTIVAGGRCAEHRAERERDRGSRQARGYDTTHTKLRAQWAPRVAQGGIHRTCPGLLPPDQPFDLGHDRYDRTRWTGPEWPACNRATAATH